MIVFLQLLGFVLNVWAQSSGDADVEMEVVQNVTGVLGEEVVLRCLYKGREELLMSSWTRKEGRMNKRLAGYHQKLFSLNPDFSEPVSPSNLSVRMRISSLEAEREYTCSFSTMQGMMEKSVFLTVLARPVVRAYVEESEQNGTHFQTVTCSALAGKPAATIAWETSAWATDRHSGDGFSVVETTARNPNGTATRTSALRFATGLQEAREVTCSVAHPALTAPLRETVSVRTFVAPTMTLEIQNGEGEAEFTCVAMGGRPAPDITWLLPGDDSPESAPESSPQVRVWWDKGTDTARVTSWLRLQVHRHEGENVTCIVAHPKLPLHLKRTIALPTYELSSVRVVREGAETDPETGVKGRVVLEEGQRNVSLRVEVTGTVPQYRVHCSRENGSLPAGVEVSGNVLHFEGPVEPHHTGLYTCKASYYSHALSVTLEIAVAPIVVQPAVIPPSIAIRTWEDTEHQTVECSASDAMPIASVSWSLSAGLSGTVLSNSTSTSTSSSSSTSSSTSSRNGTHSVVSLLLLPTCSALEDSVDCVVDHPGLAGPETHRITLPVCERPNVTIQSHAVWEDGAEITEVECVVNGGDHRTTIVWRAEARDGDAGAGELPEGLVENRIDWAGSRTVHSLVRLPTLTYAGRVVACVVDHPALEDPEVRKIWVTLPESGSSLAPPAPVLGVSLRQQAASPLWLAICEFTGPPGGVNLTWVVPDNAAVRPAFRSGLRGDGRLWARSAYEFPLARHQGENLSCLVQDGRGTEERTLHVPRFYMWSLRVLNRTTPYRWAQDQGSFVHRVVLQASVPGQTILLKAYGNMPQYNLTCTRSDGRAVRTSGSALVFPPEVSEEDTGLYTCRASFDAHSATLLLRVDVTSEDFEPWMLAVICVSTATALTLILTVCLCVFCKRNGDDPSRSEASHGKRESLATLTSLMQDPCSPEPRKSDLARRKCQEYAELVRYSIVIDVKTKV